MATDRINLEDFLDPKIRKELKALDKELANTISTMTRLTKEASQLNKEFKPKNIQQVTKSRQKLNKVQNESTKSQQKLTSTAEKYKQKIQNVSREEERLKMELQEKRKETKAQVQYNKAAQGSIDRLNAANKVLRERLKGVNQESERGRKRANALRKAINKNDERITSMSDNLTKQKRNIGNYTSAFGEMPGPIGQATQTAQQFGMVLRTLSKIPIVMAITAIVAALAGLVKLLSSTASGAKQLRATLDGLGAILTVIKNNVIAFGKNAIDWFQRTWKQAQKLIAQVKGDSERVRELRGEIDELSASMEKRDPFGNMAQDASDAYSQVHKLSMQMEGLKDEMVAAISEQAILENQLERFKKLADDQTKSERERMKYLQRAMSTAKEFYGIQERFAEREFKNMVKREAAKNDIRAETLERFIKMDHEEAMSARETNEEIAKYWENAGRDKIKQLEEAYREMYEADTKYQERVGELTSELTGIKKRLMEEEVKEKEKQVQEMIESERMMSQRIQGIQNDRLNNAKATLNDIEYKEKESLTAREKFLRDFESEVKNMDKSLLKHFATMKGKEGDIAKKELENRKQQRQKYTQFGIQQAKKLSQSIFQYRQQELQAERDAAIEKAKARGASEEEIRKIEKEYARKRKQEAISKAIINGAIGITSAFAPYIPGVSEIMAAIVATTTALQVATIKAQKFAKGTKDSGPEGQVAWVGEEGTEAMKDQKGNVTYTPDKPTLTYVPPHTEIVPNKQLQQDLANMEGGTRTNEDMQNERRHRELMNELRGNKDVTYMNVTENGFHVTAKKGNTKFSYIDRKYRS